MIFRLVNETIRQNALNAINALEMNSKPLYIVSIETEKQRRTKRQNAYLWGVVYRYIEDNDPGFFNVSAQYAKQEIIHAYCKQVFLPADIETLPSERGTIEVLLMQSTTKLTPQDFNEYVENIRRWAADELEIFIPDPVACGYEDLVK